MQPRKTPIMERARGRWQEILPALGVSLNLLTGKHVACPVCGGKDRFRFDNKEGKGTWICSHGHGGQSDNGRGAAGNGFALVMDLKGCEFSEAARLVEEVIGVEASPLPPKPTQPADDGPSIQKMLRELWGTSRRVTSGDPVSRYLNRRGLTLSTYPAGLRYLPSCWHPEAKRQFPAMLARVSDWFGDGCGLHRTFLTEDGRKADVKPQRMALGSLPDGCAVRLGEHDKLLGIAEGIETALSASIMYKVQPDLFSQKHSSWRA